MKELKIKKGRPLLNYVILTADRYTAEELTEAYGGLLLPTQVNQLKPYQTIISLSPRISESSGLKPGQLVLINIDRYGKATQKKNNLRESIDEIYDSQVRYEVPAIEIDGKECLRLGDNDIEFICEEYEFVEIKKKSPIIVEEPTIIKPRGLVL